VSGHGRDFNKRTRGAQAVCHGIQSPTQRR
jgi:hypothetical protein